MADWIDQLLTAIGAPVTAANRLFVQGWNNAEGNLGGQSGLGINNPLNTTQTGPGSSAVNSVGVQSFPSIDAGVAANAQTLQNGRYPDIVSALQSGNPFSSITSAVKQQLGTWGTGAGWLTGFTAFGGTSATSVGISLPRTPTDQPTTGTIPILTGAQTAAQGAAQAATTAIETPLAPVGDFFKKIGGIGDFIGNGKNWWKILFAAIGAGLILAGLWVFTNGPQRAIQQATTAAKAAPMALAAA